MRNTAKFISSTLIASIVMATPANAQSIFGALLRGGLESLAKKQNPAAPQQQSSVDAEFCSRSNITSVAAQLTRNWGERFAYKNVEVVAQDTATIKGEIASSSSSEIICRMSFRNFTSTLPMHKLALVGVDFRYSEPAGKPQLERSRSAWTLTRSRRCLRSGNACRSMA